MKKVLSLLMMTALITGCGDGSSSGTGGAPVTGTFVDDPVGGLKYTIDGISRFTDASGNFECATGQTITFSIGNLDLGTASCGSIVTPLDLVGTQDHTNTKVSNIALVLQNLDDGTGGGSVITIPKAYHSEDFSGITLTETNDANIVTAFNNVANVPAATVTTKAAARTALEAGLNTKYNGKQIKFSFKTDSTCDALDNIPVTGKLTINTGGGTGSWSAGAATGDNVTVNGAAFPVVIKGTPASTGFQTLSVVNNVLSFYQGSSSPNTNLSGTPWLCSDDSSGGGILTQFDVGVDLTFSNGHGGSGVVKEIYKCGANPVQNKSCGSFTFTIE
jgi:hypothetical protein